MEKNVDGSIIDTKVDEFADAQDCVRSVFLTHEQVVIGTADNTLRVYPISASLSVGASKVLSSGHAEGNHKEGRINCVCYSPDESNLFLTGGSDDVLVLWDGRDAPSGRKSLHRMPVGGTPMAMDWATAAAGQVLIGVILKNGRIKIVDVDKGQGAPCLREGACIAGRGCGTAMRFSPDGRFLAAGRRNGRLDLYQGDGAGKFEHCKGFAAHSGPCCALDWSGACEEAGPDCLFLRSNSYLPTEELKVWLVPTADAKDSRQARRIKDWRNKVDVSRCEWQRESCRVSWAAKGLINGEGRGPETEYRPTDHVSCLASPTSPEERHLACGCDDGVLRLFGRPCLGVGTLGRPSFGHAAVISSIAYSHAADRLVSTSVNLAVLQWEVMVPRGCHSVGTGTAARDGMDCDSTVAALQEILDDLKSALRGSGNLSRALRCLDDGCRQVEWAGPAVDDWKAKLCKEARRVIKTACLQAKLLRQGASDHLDRGDIDRNGWPASARLAAIRDLSKQLLDNANIARLAPDLQSDLDMFKRMEALAEEEQGRMDELIAKQQQGFDYLDVAQGHVEALLAELRSCCCGSNACRMPSPACMGTSLYSPYSPCAILAMSLTLVSCLASRSSSRAREETLSQQFCRQGTRKARRRPRPRHPHRRNTEKYSSNSCRVHRGSRRRHFGTQGSTHRSFGLHRGRLPRP